jgi:hypothetical protein
MRVPILVFQLIPILVLLLPLIEAVGFAMYWRRSLSSPWVYALVGTVVAYAVGLAVVFAVEQLRPPHGTVITSASPVWRDNGQSSTQVQASKVVRSDNRPTFEPLTPSWYGLLAIVVVLCGLALWGLKHVFRSPAP